MEYFQDLEFDLPTAMLSQLVGLFDQMTPGPLNERAVSELPEEQGVYQLFFKDNLVYVGKTDADAGLKQRLLRHAKKIRSRQNLHQSEVTFKAVRVYVFTMMDLEALLIKHYRSANMSLAWNFSGFGSNDPGRNRDNSKIKKDHFDSLYPIDLEFKVRVFQSEADQSVAMVLKQLKENLPYTIRYENAGGRSKQPHNDLMECQVQLSLADGSALDILRKVKAALGDEWQITALPGYVIIYKESVHYAEGKIIQLG